MGSDSELAVGYRFDPTKELLSYLQPKPNGLNGKKFADIPPIRMQKHHPSEFAALGALMGKDGMYILADWDKKHPKGKRKNRRVETDSETGQWKLQGSEPIRSSDGDKQIGTKKNYDFKVPDSLVEWHMEEYLLYPEESSQVSICRVSKKCIQGRRRTKIDAEVDNVDHLCPEANNTKGKKEAAQSCISDTGNDIDINEMVDNLNTRNCQSANHTILLDTPNRFLSRDTGLLDTPNHFLSRDTGLRDMPICSNAAKEHVDNLVTTNWVYSLDDNFQAEHYVDNLVTTNRVYSLDDNFEAEHYVDNLVTTNWVYSLDDNFQAEHYVDNLVTTNRVYSLDDNFQAEHYVDNLVTTNWVYSLDDNFQAEHYVDNLNTRNCQSPNHTVLLDSPNRKYIRLVENVLLDEEDVDNLDTGNCQSANDTVLGMNATEMVDNLDSGNCPLLMDMDAIDDVTTAGNCVSSPGQTIFYKDLEETIFYKDLEDTCQLLNQPRSI